APVAVTVSNQSHAVYNATRRAPTCGTVTNACDSFGLVDGRGPLGPEPNAPNAINGSCSDTTSGTYHVNDSIDRIRVVSTDGGPFTTNHPARVEVGVWAYNSNASVTLYHAPSAASPQWTKVGYKNIWATEYSTLTFDLTLTEGSQQAVRAVLVRGGITGGACPTAEVRDIDDLVLAVNSIAPVCGNGIRENGEACDGAALGGQTCTGLGYGGGTLSCTASCTLNTSACTPAACIAPGAGLGCTATTSCCSGVGNCTGGSPSQRTCR
ncbi:MAG TPA: hypothetical protein VN759_09135, partial [Pseudolysinimonas sp.]|nr:hypothetical protein [Pseudolysinimonas sp.]